MSNDWPCPGCGKTVEKVGVDHAPDCPFMVVAPKFDRYKKIQHGAHPDPWAHRSSNMRCRTCMWYVAKLRNQSDPLESPVSVVGRCRRHAPTMGGFPVVFESDWCGDHRLNENEVR